MRLPNVKSFVRRILRRRPAVQHSDVERSRGPQTHVIILDGTMSSLTEGMETNAGHTFRLVAEMAPNVSLFYEAGVQFTHWKNAPDVMMGRGINKQIRRAYGFLASRYRPGDRIFLFGYSRGAFAARSLAGVIDRVGLLSPKYATVRHIRQAYRHYEKGPDSATAADFKRLYCYPDVEIEMIGVWDTVKALGVRLPIFWRWAEVKHGFHNHHLGKSVKNGFQALAMDETRLAYEPVLWECPDEWEGRAEQVWFKGAHGDVGGHISGFEAARPLANIPLVWMLERAEACGLPLPQDWNSRFVTDVTAPSVGTWSGWGKIFLLRGERVIGKDRSERIHDSAQISEKEPERRFWPFKRQA
ncbi:MAG: DUF2235 domain-containing protein [Cognatishimia sp.]